MIFSLPLCLYCCLWEHQLLPRGFVETTLSFVSFEKSFQRINALLPSPPIYQPVCIIWVLWCCSVWESSLFGLFWNLPKVPKQHPPHSSVPVWFLPVIISCDFSLWSSPGWGRGEACHSRLLVCLCTWPCQDSAFPQSHKSCWAWEPAEA